MANESILAGSWRNIVRIYELAPSDAIADGATWYAKARDIASQLATMYNLTLAQGAGILAALSPSLSWERNVTCAWDICATRTTKWQSGANIAKALRILDGATPLSVLGGRKVIAFYHHILGIEWEACIDRHAVSVYRGTKVSDSAMKRLVLRGVHDRIAKAYGRASRELGVPVHVVQAVTWVTWRQSWAARGQMSLGMEV